MLSHYSPLKVAENFRMLETLFPGRIDLGIGRAPGSDQRTARALRQGLGHLGIEHFPEQIADLIAFLEDRLAPDHPFAGVRAMPAGPLPGSGSSDRATPVPCTPRSSAPHSPSHTSSAPRAGRRRCACTARRFAPPGPWSSPAPTSPSSPSAPTRRPRRGARPGVAICFCCGCSGPLRTLPVRRGSREPSLYGSRPGDHPAHPPADDRRGAGARPRSPPRPRRRVRRRRVGLVSMAHDFKARVRSYELLAEAFALPRP